MRNYIYTNKRTLSSEDIKKLFDTSNIGAEDLVYEITKSYDCCCIEISKLLGLIDGTILLNVESDDECIIVTKLRLNNYDVCKLLDIGKDAARIVINKIRDKYKSFYDKFDTVFVNKSIYIGHLFEIYNPDTSYCYYFIPQQNDKMILSYKDITNLLSISCEKAKKIIAKIKNKYSDYYDNNSELFNKHQLLSKHYFAEFYV